MSQFFPSGGRSVGSFSFSISPSSEYSGLMSLRVPWKIIFATALFQESWDFEGIMLSSDSVFVYSSVGFHLWGEDCSSPPRAVGDVDCN